MTAGPWDIKSKAAGANANAIPKTGFQRSNTERGRAYRTARTKRVQSGITILSKNGT
jgi:hypothetical protein